MANFLKKIQDLPAERKRIILWSIVGILGLILFIFWFKGFKEKVERIQGQTSAESHIVLK